MWRGRVKRRDSCRYCCCRGIYFVQEKKYLYAFYFPSFRIVMFVPLELFNASAVKVQWTEVESKKFIVEERNVMKYNDDPQQKEERKKSWRKTTTRGDVTGKYSFPLQMINRKVEMKLTMRFPHVTFSVFSFLFPLTVVSRSVDKSDKKRIFRQNWIVFLSLYILNVKHLQPAMFVSIKKLQ